MAVIERKYENKFEIPFEESPKILISTNYTVEGKGSSFERRNIEFIFSDTDSHEYTPEDKFGHLLFGGWNDEEWKRFYQFITYCIQQYLKKGLIKPKFNILERKLKMETSLEFIDFANNSLNFEEKYNKKELHEKFFIQFPRHPKIDQNTFTRWLKLFADANGFVMTELHSGSENYFILTC
jgi:hypothetical protein